MKVLIVGAGVAGLALARQLEQQSIEYRLIEKSSASNEVVGAGIALPANAVQALRHIGLGAEIDKQAHQVHKITYSDSSGTELGSRELSESPLNKDKFVALTRHQLREILLNGLADAISFETEMTSLTQKEDGVYVTFSSSSSEEKFDLVIGADGIHSKIRKLAFPDIQQPLTDIGVTTWRWICGYDTKNLNPNYLLGLKKAFMVYPIGPDSVYCYAHVYDPNKELFFKDSRECLKIFFAEFGGIAAKILRQLPDNVISGRLESVSPPVFTNGKVVLIGDASHACSPMLQQGAAQALEDVVILVEFLNNFELNMALRHYQRFREERVRQIIAASDGPMKQLASMTFEALESVKEMVRKNGPLNVLGWIKLLDVNPIEEVQHQICKIHAQASLAGHAPPRLAF